jgi:hypothetical protein
MRPSHKTLLAGLALSLSSLTFPATATHLEIQGGRSYMDSYATNTAFVESVFDEHRIGDSRFSWSPDISLGWINGREVARYRNSQYTTHDDVWLLAGGARFRFGDEGNWYRRLFLSFQPALQTGRTQALSSAYEFVSTLGWQGRRFSVQIRHVSNAGLHNPNRGETMALVGIGFDL